MANRRMFSIPIISTAKFLQMPASTRLLYYDLGMRADDDGFVESFAVMRMTNASEDDLRLLEAKGYIKIVNDDLTAYICDWTTNNQIRKDRYQESLYHHLLPEYCTPATSGKPTVNQVATTPATSGKPTVNQVATTPATSGKPTVNQVATTPATSGKPSIGKYSIVKDSSVQSSLVYIAKPPTLDEVIEFAEKRDRIDIAETFFYYYDSAEWHDSTGEPVRSWKQKFMKWEQTNPKKETKKSTGQIKRNKVSDSAREDIERMEKYLKKIRDDSA